MSFHFKNKRFDESGQTLLETLATLSIVGLLAIGAIKGYHLIVEKAKAQNTAKMIKTLAFERQNMAMNETAEMEVTVRGPHGNLTVKNGTPGNYSKYFWVETTLTDKTFCDALKNSNLIQADLIEVNGAINGNCGNNSKLTFYFKKNRSSEENLTWVDGEGKVQKCPNGSSACDNEGNATACETGYYLNMGECARCGAHVATCEDEETPLTCMDGYELHWGECILPPQMCTTDAQCDACATCDTTTGRCQGECEQPTNRCYKDADCGMNNCIVCDTDTHSCQNECTKVGYLASTGTQWINTDIIPTQTTKVEMDFELTSIPSDTFASLFGILNNDYSGYMLFLNYSVPIQARTGSTSKPNTISTFQVNTDRYHISLEFNKLTINGFTANPTQNNTWTTINQAMYLYGGAGIDANRRRVSAKIYYTKIWDGGELVRDFIPVSSPKGNCMFDRVTEKLFCNANTSGTDFLTD